MRVVSGDNLYEKSFPASKITNKNPMILKVKDNTVNKFGAIHSGTNPNSKILFKMEKLYYYILLIHWYLHI